MQKIRKAIIPAAGLGTRVLPASKSIPKEMIPIVDKPAIQYIVEECAASGIEEILIITNRGKSAIEDHFDHSVELEAHLLKQGKNELLLEMQKLCNLCGIKYVRQKETKGLGHAVLCAESFAAGEPFAVLYGDDVIIGGKKPATLELIEAYEETGLCVCGIKEVPKEQISWVSSLKVDKTGDCRYLVTDMIEKPKTFEQAFSLFSILGRVVLDSSVFDILRNTLPGAGGEIQLTDAMAEIARGAGMTGVDYTGTRYDMGNKFGILKASIDVGLMHPETKEELKNYILQISKTL